MSKKMKKNGSNVKLPNKKNNKKNKSQEKNLQKEKIVNEDKLSPVKDRNLKFKSKKLKKGKLIEKFLQVHKRELNLTAADIINPDVVKEIKLKKGQNKKTEYDGQKAKKQQVNQGKQKSNKNHQTKNKSAERPSNKIKSNVVSIKKKGSNIQKQKLKHLKKIADKTVNLNLPAQEEVQQKKKKSSKKFPDANNNSKRNIKGHTFDINRLQELLVTKQKEQKKKQNLPPQSLREKMMSKLRASRFRYLNETLYSNASIDSKKLFKEDPDAFKAYHDGYKQQVEQWPLNPLDIIISSIKKMPKEYIIADFGCGEAKLAASVPQKVNSFDFVSLNENVTVCDVAHTPLLTNGVHIVVLCLSLMGTNLKDYIIEANRVLKMNGILKIAEVESRFEKVEDFINTMSSYGFKNTWTDLSHNLFYFLDFKKEKDISSRKSKLPPITLKPCLYKKR